MRCRSLLDSRFVNGTGVSKADSFINYQSRHGRLNLERALNSALRVKVTSKGERLTYHEILINSDYDVPIQAAMKVSSAKPFVVLDLGANVGYFAFRVFDPIIQRHLDDILADITMVEGSPETFGKLEERVRPQRLNEASVRTVNGLAGWGTGSASIRESAAHAKSSIMAVPAVEESTSPSWM
jgi:hypothetical protein